MGSDPKLLEVGRKSEERVMGHFLEDSLLFQLLRVVEGFASQQYERRSGKRFQL